MDRAVAVLTVPDVALVRWPDGQLKYAWDLPAGSQLEVVEVIPLADGFLAVAHPVDAPEVFALVRVCDLEFADTPVPF